MPSLFSASRRLICPYCYLPFQPREIKFRCTGLRGPAGEGCERKRDEKQEQYFGLVKPLPPAFSAKGERMAARCPHCRGETTQRICPHCHSLLPVHFDRVDNKMIAMVGAKATGKTVYMTVLLHELMHSVGRRFNAAVVGSDDHTRAEFSRRYEKTLYRERMLPGTTRTARAEPRRPLVFKVTLDEQRRLRRSRNRDTITSFFDTAGEDLTSRESVELNVRYLAAADGIILLLDPLQMRGARKLARPGTPLPVLDEHTDSPVNVLARVTDLLYQAQQRSPQSRVPTPIAVAFSKIDALRHTFSADSPLLWEPPSDKPCFDEADSLAVHEYVRALLHEWEGGQIDHILTRNYTAFRYFGLSALGDSPTENNEVDPKGIRPYRVADPFLWLLSRFGMVPTSKG
ncbi:MULTISPECIES: TRAFAC clade GTPase domain-containing protein [Thermomonospora]|uniref:Double-GTPase 2 domain-containing protein n=1 Tax=Thermomonospora curvata (strain ATCC 19995 / DSM 43183 / JCM 3096 / KCTC 9072 / NBRC 15933 / NCIMB 10081 / Henssen B9) TaxID=471852 RepID=D1AA42_THECD|nr:MULTISPECIES: hypothetical protein [Thermomonospora]ACY96978.1 hypothetical protein Tcur_1397 [Thermomonospora curvata DSM 43183]PKK15254.1 MAG: hypothetical protein BUE48_006820 [Thermomonospora sp. CIF 1]